MRGVRNPVNHSWLSALGSCLSALGSCSWRVRTAWPAGLTASGALLIGCGAASSDPGSQPLGEQRQSIVEGYVDEVTSGVVGLGVFEANHFFAGNCSGSLIAPNLVLTARHCIAQSDYGPNASDVICGETEFEDNRAPQNIVVSPETERPTSPNDPSFVRGQSIHVVPGGNDICGYDVALVILEESFDASEATPIVPRIDERARNNEVFSATGYGQTDVATGEGAGTRMRTDQRSVMCTQASCDAFSEPLDADTEWLSMDANVCSGDSGGPALDEEGRVIGVVSRGPASCDSAIYGDVAVWGEFIIDVGLLAAEAGGYEPPSWTSGSSEGSLVTAPTGEVVDVSSTGASDETAQPDDDDEESAEDTDDRGSGISQLAPERALADDDERDGIGEAADDESDDLLACDGDDCGDSSMVQAEAAACGFVPGQREGWRAKVAVVLLSLFGWIRFGRRRRSRG